MAEEQRGLRKFIMRASVLLALGAVVNIGVAWGLPEISEDARREAVILTLNARARHLVRWAGQGAQLDGSLTVSPAPSNEPVMNDTRGTWFALSVDSDGFVRSLRTGWPALSLEGPMNQPSLRKGFDGAFAAVVAKRPIWPGFAINTLFYATILWLLFTAPFAIRRRVRIRRGLCPACAYPVGVSPLCTECGKPVTPGLPVAV